MATVSLQLHLSFTPSFLTYRYIPRSSRNLQLPSHVPRPVFSSANKTATATGPPEFKGSPPAQYAEDDSIVLPAELRRELMPRHVAVIMDGNRRWARMRGLSIGLGYEAGVRSLRRMVELCCKWGIRVLTVFAFSSENWLRPIVETNLLMGLFDRGLRDELQHLMSADVRISFIGDSAKLLN
ncbi:hypothetical protein CDL12_02213 [Handroanthus impetiginosus]|uniref:Alkyl transferase n=1 Tax=Handroanthus impetiginosus TaxID=429701 RepID=A0A2G9I5K6_9LAMI|nr:hypothetical protein CDL12_02213 [Handroanthus impetiginosus]